MAFPTVAATNSGSQNTVGTTHTWNLPASIANGDLLLIFCSVTTGSISTPSGFTQLYNSSASGNRVAGWYKVASGSEGSTITSTGDDTASSHVSFRIQTGTYLGTPEAGTLATGSGTTPNPPSLTPSFGSADNLWIALAHHNSNTNTSVPASYGNALGVTANFMSIYSGRRNNTTGTEDPGTFTVGSSSWAAQTISIKGVTYSVAAEAGAFTLSGQTAGLYYNRVVAAAAGAYTLTGIAAGLLHVKFVAAGTGAYTLTGQDVVLYKGRTIVADAGAFVLSGIDAGLIKTNRLDAEAAAFLVLGQDIGLFKGRALIVETGAYVFSGQDVLSLHTYNIIADVGAFVLTGYDVEFLKQFAMDAEAGEYEMTGYDVEYTQGNADWQALAAVNGDWTPEAAAT